MIERTDYGLAPPSSERVALRGGPILFMFGAARSGTSYLNSFMARWFDIGVGPEGTFVTHFYRRLRRYGDLANDRYLMRLLDDVSRCEMLEIIRSRYPESWRFDVRPEDIRSRMCGRTYADVIRAVLECVAEGQSRSRLGNKNPDYWRHLETLHELFPSEARYLCIVRDGRDVFLSLRERGWGQKNPFVAARNWKRCVQAAFRHRERVGPERLRIIRYEDLLGRPESVTQSLEELLEVELDATRREGLLNEIRSNPMRHNFEKWKRRMSEAEQRLYESVAGEALESLGYECRYPDSVVSLPQRLRCEGQEFARLIGLNAKQLRRRLGGG